MKYDHRLPFASHEWYRGKIVVDFFLCLIVLVSWRQKIDSYKIWKFQVFTSFMELLCGFK